MGKSEKCEDDPTPHLGNPGLVTWGGADVGDNESIKVPYVSKEVEYIRGYSSSVDDEGEPAGGTDRWMEKETWTLSGEIVDCESYEAIVSAQETLLDIFSYDWQVLAVGGDGGLQELHFGHVINITFGDSSYLDSTPYEVKIEGYRNAQDFAADRSVINPIASYTWTEKEDATMDLTYEVSAQGIVTDSTSSNALENAQAFVKDYLTATNFIFENDSPDFSPFIIFHEKNSEGKRYLASDEENIDRVRGTYGIKRVYRLDQTQGEHPSILRYTTDSSIPFGQDKKLTFDGTIENGYKGEAGDVDANMAHLRERYYLFKRDELIDPDVVPPKALSNKNILSEKVDEDKLAGILTFNIVFGAQEACVDDFSVSVEESAESSLIRVNITGQVKHMGPCDFDEVKKCFYTYGDSQYDPDHVPSPPKPALQCDEKITIIASKYYPIAQKFYEDYFLSQLIGHPEIDSNNNIVNQSPLSFSITEDEGNKVINYSMSFDDRRSYGAQSFDYTVSVSPPIQQVAVNSFQEICSGGVGDGDPNCGTASKPRSHHYQDLGISKAGNCGVKLTIVGTSTQDPFAFASAKMGESIGGSGDPLLIKNTVGGDESNAGCSAKVFETHDYAWLWQKASVVNGAAGDRTKVTKLYFGSG